MLFRPLSRTLIRSTRSLSTRSVRPSTALARLSLPSASFSSTAFARSNPTPLSLKLAEEIKFEKDNTEAEPAFLADFKKDNVWAIEDTAGADEVILTRTWENESIRILFSISDIDAPQDEASFEDEASAEVQEGDEPTEETDGEGSDESFPIETTITVTKKGQGALTIDAVVEDGIFNISNIAFYKDAKLAVGLTAEDDWKRQGLYIGPDFQNLDESVQSEFENYLEERGINADLAVFIPDFAEYKEQKEYLSWLSSVKGFVEA
ncbi:hypothetical protein RQP46_006089 [Phenoliferia psychrophenolica]